MKKSFIKPVYWVSTLYFMQGIPFAIVTLVSAILLKEFNFTNVQIAFYTSIFGLPWVIKFFFAAFLERIATKRTLTLSNEYALAIVAGLITIFLYYQTFTPILILFFLMALISSWHDIASDGFYLTSLSYSQQIHYVPIRVVAFQCARLCCQSGIVIVVGWLITHRVQPQDSWAIGFIILTILMLAIATYHKIILPVVEKKLSSHPPVLTIFQEFFTRPNIIHLILFIFFYNIAEAQLIKIAPLFLLDAHQAGGLNINLATVGTIYGGIGMIAMLLGVVVSGQLVKIFRMAKCLIVFTLIFLFSLLGYVILSAGIKSDLYWVSIIIFINQFCFGLSNNIYMIFLLDTVQENKYSMSCYAIATGIMAFGMMIPGAISGYIQHYLGYFNFFVWIVILQAIIFFYTVYVLNTLNCLSKRGAVGD